MHKKTQYTVCHPIILVNIFAILQPKCYSSSNSQEVNVPKLRFKRADGSDYEQYKKETVGSLFTYTTRRNTNMECVNVITNSAELGLIPQREFFDKDIAVEENTEKYYVIEQGDFVYNPRKSASAPYGPFNCYKRIDEGIVSPLYTCLKPLFPEYTDFLLWYFASPAWHSYIYHNGAQGGARHDRVGMTKDLMDGIPVNIPEFEEQEKISKFLLLIEHRLELQRKLVDALKLYKRGALSRLFPKNGASVPEYRFSGFTGDWEQRKLSELSKSFEYGLNAAAKEFDGKNKYIRITDIDDTSHKFILDDVTSPDTDLDNAENYILKEGDILFARTGASVGKTYIYKDSDGLVYYAGFLIRARIKKNINPEFVFQNTLTKNYERYIAITSQRSGQPGVNAQEYSEYRIMMPKREEQDKISDYLRRLDTLITLHQKKVEQYINLKQSMLEKLFI